MNKQELKELIIIICGLLVLVASVILISGCQLEPLFESSIEETKEAQVVETTRQINCDSKGNIEYGKARMTPDADPNYKYSVWFYETTDSYNEWCDSLKTRYNGLQETVLDCNNVNLRDGSVDPYVYFNKMIVLVYNLDDTPYGLTEYYFENGYYNNYYSVSFKVSWTTCSTQCLLLQLN